MLSDGVAKDYEVALKWFERGASQGSARSFYGLGIMHLHGYGGVQKDKTKAMRYFQQGAEKDLPESQAAYAELLLGKYIIM